MAFLSHNLKTGNDNGNGNGNGIQEFLLAQSSWHTFEPLHNALQIYGKRMRNIFLGRVYFLFYFSLLCVRWLDMT